MNEYFKSIILQSTGASALIEKEVIQELWSGYGKIMRVRLKNASAKSVVVKHVQLPMYKNHPRGWNTDIGHQRKVKSYQVETTWYNQYSKDSTARLPKCLAIEIQDEEVALNHRCYDKINPEKQLTDQNPSIIGARNLISEHKELFHVVSVHDLPVRLGEVAYKENQKVDQ